MQTKASMTRINASQQNASSGCRRSSNENLENVETPTSFFYELYRVICDSLLLFCRHIVFAPIVFKLIVCFSIVIIGSMIKSFNMAPNSYFASKRNILNQYFAKLGWGWTMSLLVPFLYLSLLKTHTHYQIITNHLTRLFIATGLWYTVTNLFVNIELHTGTCSNDTMKDLSKKVCLRQGHEWIDGFDFSGHTFLLFYAILIINEEIRIHDRGANETGSTNKSKQENDGAQKNINDTYSKMFSKIARVLYILLAILTILWEFMLLSTALYFHHTTHKIGAVLVTVVCWYMTYRVWYTSNSVSILRPSLPSI